MTLKQFDGKYVLVEMGGINFDHTGEGVPMKVWTSLERAQFLGSLTLVMETRWAVLETGAVEIRGAKPQERRG